MSIELLLHCTVSAEQVMAVKRVGTLASYLICDILRDSRYLVGNTRVSILLEK